MIKQSMRSDVSSDTLRSSIKEGKRITVLVYIPLKLEVDRFAAGVAIDGNLTGSNPNIVTCDKRPYLIHSEPISGDVLYPLDQDHLPQCERKAYWIQRKLRRTTHGFVRVGTVVRPRPQNESEIVQSMITESNNSCDADSFFQNNDEVNEIAHNLEWVATGDMVAIKHSEIGKEFNPLDDSSGPMKEIKALNRVSQKNAECHDRGKSNHVIEILNVLKDEEHVYVVLPYCDGGDLSTYVQMMGLPGGAIISSELERREHHKHNYELFESIVKYFFFQILVGLESLHKNNISHCNLSLEKILLNTTCSDTKKVVERQTQFSLSSSPSSNCVLTGLSMCILDDNDMSIFESCSREFGSESTRSPYMSPELLLMCTTSATSSATQKSLHTIAQDIDPYKCDVWSAGVVLYSMLNSGKPPFEFANQSDILYDSVIAKNGMKRSLPSWVNHETINLIEIMLNPNPEMRATLEDCMKHSWLVDS